MATNQNESEVSKNPAIGELVIDYDRITEAVSVAERSGRTAGEKRVLRERGQEGARLVVDSIGGVDRLDVVSWTNLSINVGWRARAALAARHRRTEIGPGQPGKVLDWGRHGGERKVIWS